ATSEICVNPVLPSEFEYRVGRSALGATRPVNIGVVRINKRALLAPEDVVLTGGGFEPFSAKFVIHGHAAQRREQNEHVEKKQLVGRHGGCLAALPLVAVSSSVCH